MLLGITPSQRSFLTPLGALLTAALVAIALTIVGKAVRRARGTTLVAPLVWSFTSLLVVIAAYVYLIQPAIFPTIYRSEKWWVLALCSTFCPMMSLLGAKRPQNRAWQWIVLSFWIVAALPAIQQLVLQPLEPLEVSTVWRWFYAILLLISAVNYFPTRYAPAGLLATAGQTVLLSPYLPMGPIVMGHPLIGIPMLGAAVCLARVLSGIRFSRQRASTDEKLLPGWTNVWLDFRDAYGLLWGARMMERIDSLLQSSNVPVWLDWNGFHCPSSQADRLNPRTAAFIIPVSGKLSVNPSANTMDVAESGIRNLLRRFVSNDWIDRRLHVSP
jgi:hypothetical protein